jgi:hypothetical protein
MKNQQNQCNMKKQLSIMMALAVLAIGIITSCKKDPIPNNNEQNNEQPSDTIPSGNDTIPNGNDTIPIGNDTIPIGNDTIPNGNDTIPVVIDGIRFGDTTGMKVTTYNTIMEFDDAWNPILLDLNNDGTNDIRIETYYDGPLAIGQFQELTLHCLSSIKIHGESIEKESYSHRDTTITNYNGWTQIISNYTYSTCGQIDENDPVSTSNVFEITANDFNDHLNFEDNFQFINSTFLFRENVEYTLMNDPNEEEQIVTGSHTKHIYSCWNFPTDEEKYIGFRITKNGNSRYGWLKIKLHPTWGGKVVDTELIETAIQK